MAILVDEIRTYATPLPVKRWCHMASDTSLEELHDVAAAIGLPRRAFHRDHYDLTPPRRESVLTRGAIEVTTEELLARMVGPRGERYRARAARNGGATSARRGATSARRATP